MNRAANEDLIYEIEDAIEDAVKALLLREVVAGVSSFQVLTARETDEALAPYYDVQFILGPATGHEIPKPDGSIVYDQFEGTLAIAIFTNRTEAQLHSKLRARANKVVARIARGIREDGVLPYHEVLGAFPMGGSDRVDAGKDLDASELTWRMPVAVRPDAWPH